ncbi:MAG: glycosyltransferase [Nitrospirota bacterium]|nr:glycosyltransferase [Nitrospirota bacterium]
MEGISIIIPVFNKIEVTEKCISRIREKKHEGAYEIIIIDNASSDATPDILADASGIVYLRNNENLGLAKACNRASAGARYDVVCFMHNDLFLEHNDGFNRIRDFVKHTPDAGVVGLYGAKTMRADGSFRGRSIVHAIAGAPRIARQCERVAVVDGLLIAMRRAVFMELGGFDDGYTQHYYDKDLSMRALERRMNNYVLNIPFEHQAGTSRKEIKEDDLIREEARQRFIVRWKGQLPTDVSTFGERLKYLLRRDNG